MVSFMAERFSIKTLGLNSCAVWPSSPLLTTTRNEQNTRPAVWALLGLVAGTMGALLYIAVCVYEQRADADA